MTFKEKLSLARSDMQRHHIPGTGFVRFLKLWSIPGCKYMIINRLSIVGVNFGNLLFVIIP